MKRKITCMLLALMLVISLLPLGAIRTYAASNLNYSENVVNLIKQFEGFRANAYLDGSQWTVGYGTLGYQGQVITMAEADAAMRAALNQINDRINQFAASNNLYLTQYQHDALVSFSYNCGTEWTTQGGRFFDAVTRYTTPDQFLFAISLWANVGTTPDANLLNRRMCEANLYLNNIYSASAPSAYTYVIFNPNGGQAGNGGEDKMQGYQTGSNVNILVGNPTKTGYSFGGWFTSPTGGASVKYLTSANARGTLYAQYGIPASIITTTNVRNSASINSHVIGTLNAGTQIVIVETTTHSNLNWGRCADGWVELSATNYTGSQITPVQPTGINAGTVVCNTGVNVRSGAGTNYSVVGAARNGERVTIYEINNNWGRIGDGRWISLQYVRLDSSSSSSSSSSSGIIWDDGSTSSSTGFGTQGTVTASVLNVRQNPGTSGALVGKLPQGSVVTVYEQSIVGNAPWGRIGTNQWVCLNYVSMSSTPTPSPAPSGDVIATGTVVSYTKLNVRSGAGTSAPLIGSLMPNTPVNIYEKVTVNGVEWGRIGSASQWVCLAYVNISGQPTPTPTPTPTTGTGTVISVGNLNVRTGPGTNYPKYGSLPSGSTVTITEVVTNGNQQWGKTDSGFWVCMTYIRMNGTPTPTPSGNTGRVTTGLNVRQYAGTSYPIVAKLSAGTTVTVYEMTVVNGVSWGRIGANQWVCMNYVQMIGGSGINWQ